jgi:hypothetical protein
VGIIVRAIFIAALTAAFAIGIYRDIRDGRITRVSGGHGTSKIEDPLRFSLHMIVKIVFLSVWAGVFAWGFLSALQKP